jgi:hypothetical protein
MIRGPVMGISRNPIEGVRYTVQVEPGRTLLELAPKPEGLMLCILNGQVVSRLTDAQRRAARLDPTLLPALAHRADNWATIRVDGVDVLVWQDNLPQNREVVRVALQVVSIIISYYFPAAAPWLAALNVAFNVLVPPKSPKQPDPADSIYSSSLSGNVPRLNDPIPKVCGRVKFNPVFACLPYQRFEASDPLHPDHNRDAYSHSLFCIGIDDTVIEKALIAKTSINHFQDITVNDPLAPGVQPSVVKANTVTATEVSSSELDSKEVDDVFEARYVGGFSVCRPGDRVVALSIDVGADQGLGKTAADGDSESRGAEWQIEQRAIDDYGRPVSEWEIVATEHKIDDTNTPQRWTTDYTEVAPIRAEVRVVRIDLKGHTANIRDGIQWIGLRGELEREAPLSAAAQHYEVVMRGSDQLSQQSARDFAVIARALLRTWTEADGWSATREESRNPGWWALDLLREAKFDEVGPRWGLNEPDSRIDIASYAAFAETCRLRQDNFDFLFNDRLEGWDALVMICRAGRARPFRRNGVISVARDELVEACVRAFTPRNTIEGTLQIEVALPRREQPDGVIAQFLSNVTWVVESIECPCPGYAPSGQWGTLSPLSDYDSGLPEMENPIVIFYAGITGRTHAEREGIYDAADMVYRRTRASCDVEMEGAVVAFMDPCLLLPEYPGYGQSGDVAFWDEDTLTMTLSEPVDWTAGTLYLTLRKDDGSLTDAVEVSPGATANEVILPAAPDFDLILDAADRERPTFLLGHPVTGQEVAKVVNRASAGKSDEGAQLFTLSFVIDDDRVHTADNHLLPGPGDIQDPVDDGTDYDDSGGGLAVLVRMRDVGVLGGNIGLPDDTHRGGLARFILRNDGHAAYYAELDADGSPTEADDFPGMWLNATVDPLVAATYEVYMEVMPGSEPYVAAGALLTADYQWDWSADDAVSIALFGPESILATLRLKIRKIGTTLILSTSKVYLTVTLGSSPP